MQVMSEKGQKTNYGLIGLARDGGEFSFEYGGQGMACVRV